MAKDVDLEFMGVLFMQSHTEWSPLANGCTITGTNTLRWGLLANLLVDLSLLCIMFVGVLRKKNATYLWKILYFQSIFWILSAIFTEVPSVVRRRRLDFEFFFLCSHA